MDISCMDLVEFDKELDEALSKKYWNGFVNGMIFTIATIAITLVIVVWITN